jgi:translocation and assembly module TamB
MASKKTVLKKIGRITLYILLGFFALVLLLIIFINLPVGKRVVRNQVESYLQNKLHTKVSIGAVDYSLPEWLEIKNVYIEDQHKDSLLFGEQLRVDLNMFKLIRGNTDIEKVVLKNIFINIKRAEKDSFFNYQFLVDAFTGNKSTTANPDTAEMKISLKHLIFDTVALHFSDKFGGNDFYAKIKNLDATLDKFQPDRVQFGIKNFDANGVDFSMNTYKESIAGIPVKKDSIAGSTYGLYISANGIHLKNVNVQVDNKISGLHYANNISQLSLTNALFSIVQKIGKADSLFLDSSSIAFAQPKKLATPDSAISTTPSKPWLFQAKHFNVINTQIRYDDNNVAAKEGLDFSHLDINKLNAAISAFKFSKDTTKADVSQLAFKDKSGFELDTTHVNFIFTDTLLAANEIYIKTPRSLIQKSFHLTFDSLAAIKTAPQNAHIAAVLSNSTIDFNELYTLMPALKKSLPPAQFGNLQLNINTELRGSLARLYLPYFQLNGLSGSKISARGTVFNLTDPNRLSYDLYIDHGTFLKKDLLKFIPPPNQASFAKLPEIINLKGHFTGTKNNLTADVSTVAKDFAFSGKLSLQNITDPAHLKYSTNISKAEVSKNIIEGFLPAKLLTQLNLPDKISAAGKLSGTTQDLTADLKLGSSYGPISIKGFLKNIKNPDAATYDLNIITPGFNVGRLIKQDSILGSVAGNFVAKGTGFDYKKMRSSIKADVASLEYNKYKYHNALLNADLKSGLIESNGKINDANIKLDYTLSADVRNKYPVVDGVINIDTAQLKNLNLYTDTLNFAGSAIVKSKSLVPRQLDASLYLDSIRMKLNSNNFYIDSIALVGTSRNGIDSITLRSPFADANAGGAFDYDKVGISLQRYINKYYKFPKQDTVTVNIPDQQLGFSGVIKKSPILMAAVPGLYNYKDINFSGSYASANADSALNFTADIPRVHYKTNTISSGAINIKSKNDRIDYEAKFDTLRTASNVLYATSINGAAAHDSISLNAITKDNKKVDWFGISGDAYVRNDIYSFKLKDNLLLNYEKWKVAPDNYISYSKEGIIVNNFLIKSDTATISIKSKELVANSPISIDVDNFNLKSISALTSGDTLFAAGILAVDATVSDLNKPLPAFTGKAAINNLEIMQNPVGNITATAEKQSENNIIANLKLNGSGNDIAVDGNYYLNNVDKQFDADVKVNALSFKTLQAFSSGTLKSSSGNIRGDIALAGKFTMPHWKGELDFDTTRFTITKLGTPYNINNQKIVFDYPKISFPAFIIKDSVNHTMKINGYVSAKTLTEYDLALDINAYDFIVVNAPRAIENQFFGFAAVDVAVSVSGNSTSPNIEGDVSLNDKSDVTIVLPQNNYGKNDGKTVVRFIDRDTFNINPPVVGFEQEKQTGPAFGRFLNYNLNIGISKQAALTIIVDPSTGDEVKVQGDAQLNAGVDPGGNIVLSGTYQLDKGYYDLHYQFLERKFELERGSSITFAGPPTNAQVNITAAYTVNTSAKELLSNEVSNASPTLTNSFNQQLPFKVVLYLTGQLSKPVIAFDIQVDENSNLLTNDLKNTIDNKLLQLRSDAAATNKQVFSLLLFNRFVGEQSSDFFKGNGGGFSDIARQSVSQFLSTALNQIAGDLFKGINVDLNLNSYNDFSNGGNQQRTDLNVAVSKSFLDNRLTVTVGQNFGIQGQDAASKAAGQSTGFKPDVTVGYKLTPDGKYLLRAYTKNQFEVTLDGYVVENGLAFIVTMDYDKFKELFQSKKKKKGK